MNGKFFDRLTRSERKAFTVEHPYSRSGRRTFTSFLSRWCSKLRKIRSHEAWCFPSSCSWSSELSWMSSCFIVWKNWFLRFAPQSRENPLDFTFCTKLPTATSRKSGSDARRPCFSATQREITINSSSFDRSAGLFDTKRKICSATSAHDEGGGRSSNALGKSLV